MQNETILEELERVGEIRSGGCLLRVDGDSFVMEESRRVFNRHRLAKSRTSPERLEAHWSGFVETVGRRTRETA